MQHEDVALGTGVEAVLGPRCFDKLEELLHVAYGHLYAPCEKKRERRYMHATSALMENRINCDGGVFLRRID